MSCLNLHSYPCIIMTLHMQARQPCRKELRVVKPGRLTALKTFSPIKTDFAAFNQIFAQIPSIRPSLLDMEKKKLETNSKKQLMPAANFFQSTPSNPLLTAISPTSNHRAHLTSRPRQAVVENVLPRITLHFDT